MMCAKIRNSDEKSAKTHSLDLVHFSLKNIFKLVFLVRLRPIFLAFLKEAL